MKEALKNQEPKPKTAFRDKYLAAVLAVAALLISSVVSAQTTDSVKYSQINGFGFKYKRMAFDSVLMIPQSNSPHAPYRRGALRYQASDSTLQLWTGYQWNSIVTGVGNGVDTAYLYDDSTLAIETPDADYFVKIVGRHWDLQGILNNGSTLTQNEVITLADSLTFTSGMVVISTLNLPSLTTSVDTTTYKPIAVNSSGNVAKFGGWPGSGGGAGTLDATLALGGRLSTNRTVSMGHQRWVLDSAVLRLMNVDSAVLGIEMAKAGEYLRIYPPVHFSGYKPYMELIEHVADDVPGEFNNPIKKGFNIGRAFNPAVSGIWWSQEPNYRPGGARFMETILEVSLPNGAIKNSRLLMSTFIERDSIGNSDNDWAMRGTSWRYSNLLDNIDYVSMGPGNLQVHNNTSGNTNFRITNGSDESLFTLAPGTSILDYTGPKFRVNGSINFTLKNGTSTERELISFEGDAGVTGYMGKCNSAWGPQPYMQNGMVILAANGTPQENMLLLKPDGTGWLGNVDAYNTGTQKVNISGTLAFRGIGLATTAPQILVRRSDSTIFAMDTAAFRTMMGIGGGADGNGIYGGSGSLPIDVTVTGGANGLTFTSTRTGTNSTVNINNTSSGRGLSASSSTGLGIHGSSTDGIGILGISTNNTGIWAEATAAHALYAQSPYTDGVGAFVANPSSTNTTHTVLNLTRISTSAGANNIAGAIDFNINNTTSAGSVTKATRLISKLTTATSGAEVSQFEIQGVNGGSLARKAALAGNGQWTWDGYGSSTHTGTPTGSIQTTSAGAIIEGPVLAVGTYTPTLTGVTNVASTTAYQCQYMRVGNVVTVSGKVYIDATSTGLVEVGISLPIASSIANDYEGAGTINTAENSNMSGAIGGDPANDRVQIGIQAASSAGYNYFFTFTYQIL